MTGKDWHVWCEKDNQVVYDPHFEDYDFTIDIMDLTKTPCYEPFDKTMQIKCAIKVSGFAKGKKDIYGTEHYDKCIKNLAIAPMMGYCWYNAIAYKKHIDPDVKIVFGSMGWYRKNGEPFYEYGTTGHKDFVKECNEMMERCMRKYGNNKIKLMEIITNMVNPSLRNNPFEL